MLVGSETGTSLDFAERIVEDLARYEMAASLCYFDEVPFEDLLDCTHLLLVCSTTGDGDAPGNMCHFMQTLLRGDLPEGLFADARVAIFGLGDSSYDKFNYVSKRLWRRFQQLGAQPIIPERGEGDERELSGGLEVGWQRWWPRVREALTVESGAMQSIGPWEPLPPRLSPVFQLDEDSVDAGFPRSSGQISCRLKSSARITPIAHMQDTRLLTLEMEPGASWSPGDIVHLAPFNAAPLVDETLQFLHWDGELRLVQASLDSTWHDLALPIRVTELLRRYCDLSKIPSRTQIRRLATLVPAARDSPVTEMHLEKLKEIATDEDAYLDYVYRPKRSIVEVLADFQLTLQLPVERVFDIFSRIKPRMFSIANACSTNEVEVLTAMVDIDTKRGFKRAGVFTDWVRTQGIARDLDRAVISRGSLRLPAALETVILIATGTGIAPLRAMLQHLHMNFDGRVRAYLFYGCRSMTADFYFQQDWEAMRPMLTVHAAGSRDRGDGRKVYIDDIMREHAGPFRERALEGLGIFVAGHSRLPRLVQGALRDIWGREEAEAKLAYLKRQHRFQSETWS